MQRMSVGLVRYSATIVSSYVFFAGQGQHGRQTRSVCPACPDPTQQHQARVTHTHTPYSLLYPFILIVCSNSIEAMCPTPLLLSCRCYWRMLASSVILSPNPDVVSFGGAHPTPCIPWPLLVGVLVLYILNPLLTIYLKPRNFFCYWLDLQSLVSFVILLHAFKTDSCEEYFVKL